MEGGSVGELLDVAVERPVLDQLQVEVGRTLEDRVQAGLTGNDGKSVTCRRSTRPAAISARFIDRLPCERNGTSDSSFSRATMSTASPLTTVASGQSRGPFSVVDTTVAGRLLIRVTHGSRTSDSSVLEASIRANARYVLAPKTIRCSSPYKARRWSSNSGPCLPQWVANPDAKRSWACTPPVSCGRMGADRITLRGRRMNLAGALAQIAAV